MRSAREKRRMTRNDQRLNPAEQREELPVSVRHDSTWGSPQLVPVIGWAPAAAVRAGALTEPGRPGDKHTVDPDRQALTRTSPQVV